MTDDLVTGMRFAWRGVELVAAHRRLWPFVVGPAIVLGSLLLVAAVVAWHAAGLLVGLVWDPGPDAGWLAHVGWMVAAGALRLAFVVVAAAGLYLTSNLVASPFVDRLSQEVEWIVRGVAEPRSTWSEALADLALSVFHSLLALVVWLAVVAGCFVLGFVPIVGSVASLVIVSVVTALLLAREAMDGPMSRRRMGFVDKLRVVLANTPHALGLGLVQGAVLWIPFLNLAVLPMAVAGGTMLFCHLEREGRVPHVR